MSAGYPDGLTQAGHDAAMGCRSLADEARLQRALEERAEDEAYDSAEVFREWLTEQASPNGGGGVGLVLTVVSPYGWEGSRLDRIADARRQLIDEWVSYRTNAMTDDEIAAVEAELFGEAA